MVSLMCCVIKSIGVAFIDCTKVVLMPNGHNIQYTDQNGSELYFTVSQSDKCLTKKMKLLRVFQQIFATLTRTGASMPVQESDRLPALWNWIHYHSHCYATVKWHATDKLLS